MTRSMTLQYKEIQSKFPFITCIKCGNNEYVGIVINCDHRVISIYDYGALHTPEEKHHLLELGDIWWWESNRKIPISIFLKRDMITFRPIIKTFNSKDVTVVFGPIVNLSELAEKRAKRKTIQLVRNLK